ncbi:undecaprenyldiphospho-muramoylpentapeptide beta-N-acetylglucosaminyltransferase [Candidatus Giovannonibacteria bacterium]|nr:undecaprenyldiphospho-muramoylpentapeptide beta-N-acetylglucosaminyltransferase [Candidatus Giovannonibacteria bacterium]
MRIILTGGGTGGHFYPLVAVARSLRELSAANGASNLELIYASDDPYDADLLKKEGIRFLQIPAGKIRRYFSLKNFSDPFKSFWGILKAVWIIYLNLPDVVFAKGGYASFPTLYAARIFGIPIVLHETDAVPGKVSVWASKFAKRIAISFPESKNFFPDDRAVLTGNPVRREVLAGTSESSKEIFKLEDNLPVILVLGGSQGAEKINEAISDILPDLLSFSQIIHQSGKNNVEGAMLRARSVLEGSSLISRYHLHPFLNENEYANASKAASLIISRAGGGSIFEIAAWNIPAILIPLAGSAQNHQRENAYSYARTGAAEVIEEANLSKHILLDRIQKILVDQARIGKMKQSAAEFSKLDAADKIASEILRIALGHK